MTESFLDARGIYYRINEFKEGRKTLVFVHGLSGSSSAWRRYEEYFENDCNILTYDLRGHGESVKPASYADYEIGKFAADLRELLNTLNIKSFILIGHSLGAALALEFVLSNPGRATRLILLSPDMYLERIRFSRLAYAVISRLADLAGLFPVCRHAGRHVDYDKYQNTGDWNLRRMRADISNTCLSVYLYCLKQAYRFEYQDRLKDLDISVLIIHGKKDSLVPYENSIILGRDIKGARVMLLENANHITVLNNFREISEAIRGFV